MSRYTPWRALLIATLSVCALMASGCARFRLPRIDPTGERIFQRQPATPAPSLGPASTNLQAPPVFTDPVFPAPTGQVANAQLTAGQLPAIPQDKLTLTPARVLAPVGSEVILKAGLCTSENFLLTDSKVEWLLARDEVGEFVELGGRGLLRNPLLPWNKPKKIDNQFATGYTAKVPLQITRGTADTSDDVQVQPGEAWASITSPVEGTSRITAVAPEIDIWSNRRATATIYWVDVQWTFPAQTITAGGSQVLTTTVLRQTDGTPLEGWLVRYEVADGGGALSGNTTGQVVEVPTDAQGRASIDVTPTGNAGSVTRINTQLVRPVGFGGSKAPRLIVANGTSMINWTQGGTQYVPAPDNLGTTPLPTLDSPPLQPTPADVFPSNPSPPVSRIGPRLELRVNTNDRQVEVGRQARFQLEIENTGDSPATGIVLSDAFDKGLAFPGDPQRFQEIKKTLSDIPAGNTYSEFLTFDVEKAGELCQRFRLTYDGGGSVARQACIQGIQPEVPRQGRLEVRKQGPRQRDVGQTAIFTTSVRNVGDAPLTNIEVYEEYDRVLQPRPLPAGAQLRNGNLYWSIPSLGIGETWRREINFQCLAQAAEACSAVSVTADAGVGVAALSAADRGCIEIRPGRNVEPGTDPPLGGNVLPGAPLARGNAAENLGDGLRMELNLNSESVRVGTNTTIRVLVSNRGATPDKQIRLRVLFPAELTPDVNAIQNTANVAAQFNNGELLFAPINEIRPNEVLEFVILCRVNQAGVRNIVSELLSQNMPQPIQRRKTIEMIR